MKISRVILILPFFLLGLAFVHGQGRDMVKLKDGSVIKGNITEYFHGKYVRIQTQEGRTHQFADSLVAKQKLKRGERIVSVNPRGYFNSSTFGLLTGGGNFYRGSAASFQMVNGYQFKGRYSVGIGTGIDGMIGKRILPLFADVRAYLRKDGVSPFVVLQGGYAFHKSTDIYNSYPYIDYIGYYGEPRSLSGGLMGGVRIGVRNFTSQHFGITFSAGYRFQGMKQEYLSSFWNGEETIVFPVVETSQSHRLDVRFGIYFN